MRSSSDDRRRRPVRLRIALWVVRVAAYLPPGGRGMEFRSQWEADLIYRWQRREENARATFLCALGAFQHAWYLIRTEYTMDLIWQDLKFGLRALRRSRGLITLAVLSLAIGIGANSAIFSAVDVFMLRPLPYPDSHELSSVWVTNQERDWQQASFSVPDFVDLRDRSRSMDMAATRGGAFSLSGDFEAELLQGLYVTPGFFDVLGVSPVLGRGFTPEEGIPGNEGAVVIAHGLWQRRFGGEPEILGSAVLLDGIPYTVVGVMPEHFWYLYPGPEVWVPFAIAGGEPRDSHFLRVLARLRDGFSGEQAGGEARQIMGQISAEYPETSAGHGAMMLTLHEDVFNEGFQAGTLISTVGVLFVLLIACANVANLLLTHAAGRDREVALRGALGAGRSRIVRQFLTESGVVALLGGILGLGLAFVGIKGLLSIMPPDFPRTHEIGLSPRVLIYTAGITMMTGILFGLAPALHSSRTDLTSSLKEGGRGGGGARGGRIRKGLVVGEVALALVLLVSSALLVQGFARIRLADLGFDRSDVVAFRTLLPEAQYPDSASINDFHLRLRNRLTAIAGVESVGGTSALPLRGTSSTYYVLGGQDIQDMNQRAITTFKYVLPGYFESLDIPLLRGRDVADSDGAGSAPVVVVNQTMAQRHWPDGDPIGEQIVLFSGPVEIVGVVGDTKDGGADAPDRVGIFLPSLQRETRFMDWAVEASVPASGLFDLIRAEVSSMDPSIPVYGLMTLDDLIEQSLGGDLIMAKIMSVLALVALILALGGVYGVMAYTVTQRTREMGIRISLGAQRANVMSMVVRQGTVLALLGVGIGVLVGLGVTRGLARFLFGVNPFDPVTFAAVSGILLLAGIVATFFPARRATRVDPVVALRVE